jgi:hypothetical protein
MVTRLKLKGTNGRASLVMETMALFDSTWGKIPGADVARIDSLGALS